VYKEIREYRNTPARRGYRENQLQNVVMINGKEEGVIWGNEGGSETFQASGSRV